MLIPGVELVDLPIQDARFPWTRVAMRDKTHHARRVTAASLRDASTYT